MLHHQVIGSDYTKMQHLIPEEMDPQNKLSPGDMSRLRTILSGRWHASFLRIFLAEVQTDPGAHPVPCKKRYRVSFLGVRGRGVALTTHPI